MFRKGRQEKKGGGVVLYIKNVYAYSEIQMEVRGSASPGEEEKQGQHYGRYLL